MKNLILSTGAYRCMLADFVAGTWDENAPLSPKNLKAAPYRARCVQADPAALMRLLERLAILEHPIYGPSASLTTMALQLQSTEIHAENLRSLTQYLREHKALHLEGYITFRMPDYRHRLDVIMYSIVKKMKIHYPQP